MRKVETTFVCDDCGAPLPAEYINRNGEGTQYFNVHNYNTVDFRVNTNCWAHVNVDMAVVVDCGGTHTELCPKCRIKWLKKALKKFEESVDGE